MKYRLVIFDWDGCLAQTLRVWLRGYHLVLNELGLPRTDREIVSIFGDWHGPSKLGVKDEELFFETLYAEVDEKMKQVELYPGARRLIQTLHNQGVLVAILTSTTRDQLIPNMKRLGLANLIDLVVTGEDVKKHKPDPEGINLLLNQLKVDRSKAVMIGDNGVDVLAARSAGVDSVLFYPPEHKLFYEKRELLKAKPTYVIGSHAEIGIVLGI